MKLSPYPVGVISDGKKVFYPIPLSDGTTVIKLCDATSRFDDSGFGFVDIAYCEMSEKGIGFSILITLSESEASELKLVSKTESTLDSIDNSGASFFCD